MDHSDLKQFGLDSKLNNTNCFDECVTVTNDMSHEKIHLYPKDGGLDNMNYDRPDVFENPPEVGYVAPKGAPYLTKAGWLISLISLIN